MKWTGLMTGLLLLGGCTYVPQGVHPVEDFELERYLGTWYEIARLDHRFERGLSQVSATYSMRPDGGVDVLNRGYDRQKEKWKEAKGRAYFTGDPDVGQLKVTFFWPFYAGYNLIEIDRDNYSYALVCGPDRKYLWILSRTKELDDMVVQRLLATARDLNFATDELIFVEQ
jgi:apolipoprotein D and lipocalin family protein